MKRSGFISLFLYCASYNVFAQDIMIQKDGDEIEVTVIKISNNEVEYKKWSNPDGPSYTIPKSEVFMIKYKNGEKDVFKESKPSSDDKLNIASQTTTTKVEPTSDNAALVGEYNKNGIDEKYIESAKTKSKDKPAKSWWGILGVTQLSVLSSDDIQITVSNEAKSRYHFPYNYNGDILKGIIGEKKGTGFHGKYIIDISNKTTQTIYIDKGESFRIESDGSYHMYYNTQQVTTNQGGASGGSLNLGAVTGSMGIGGVANTLAGGINVGGGKQSSVSTTYTDQRIIAIPPHGKMTLSKDAIIPIKEGVTGWDKYKMASFSEDFYNFEMPDLQQGEYRTFNESNTPASKKYIITYSSDPEFKSKQQLEFTLYIKDILGSPSVFYHTSFVDNLTQKILETKSNKTILIQKRIAY